MVISANHFVKNKNKGIYARIIFFIYIVRQVESYLIEFYQVGKVTLLGYLNLVSKSSQVKSSPP
jgi:hypothetical protein